MNNTKIKSYVGFAIKSGKILYGVDMIILSRKKPYIVLIDDNISENSLSKLQNKLSQYKIEVENVNMEEIFPNKNCKALGIMDRNLAKAIINEVKETRI
ncbi:MAG: hypothetical protein WCR54_04190 [Clostridia bacterium]